MAAPAVISRRVLYSGRDWCASVLQSHASHPSLIYFRSVGVGSGWPATLGAMMDLALILELLVDDHASRGPSVLLRHEGLRLIGELNGLVGLKPGSDGTTADIVPKICRRLATAGYKLRSPIDAAGFAELRREHARAIQATAEHLGVPPAPLLPERSHRRTA